jgi:hypothetical protein
VRQALERNARAFTPIALTLDKQRTAPEPPSELTKTILGTFPAHLRPRTYEYLSQDGLCYARFNQWLRGEKGFKSMYTELSWDGKSAYRGSQSLKPPALSIVPIGKLESDGAFSIATWYDHDDYFPMVGIAVPRFMKELREGAYSEVLRLLESEGRVTGVRPEVLAGGAEHLVVELLSGGKKHRFWLDPSLGHALRRHEVLAPSGALAVVIENSDFIKLTAPELWLPRHCHAEWHTWPGVADKEISREIGLVVDIQATRLERVRVSPEKFTLNYDKPGDYISDARLPGADKTENGRIDYLTPPDPANLDEAIRAAQERSGYVPPRRYFFVWIVVGSVALGVAAGAFVLIRRYQQRRTTS